MLAFSFHVANCQAQQVLMLQNKTSPRRFLVIPTPKEVRLRLQNGKIIKGTLTGIEDKELVMNGEESFPFDSVRFFSFYNPNTYKTLIGSYATFSFLGSSLLTSLVLSDPRLQYQLGDGVVGTLVFADIFYFTTSYLMFGMKRKVDMRKWNEIIVKTPEGDNMRFHLE